MIPLPLIYKYITKLDSHKYYKENDTLTLIFKSDNKNIDKIKEYYDGQVHLEFNKDNELLYVKIANVHTLMNDPAISRELNSVPPFLLNMVESTMLK
ncbi:MAG: hypothetical protein ACP5L0_07815 [Caldisphaera sp.]|uniref:hypothetical protein n=1 Tax=Caldisphaera sp. TaxID=2060322 RepID=UPI003D144531